MLYTAYRKYITFFLILFIRLAAFSQGNAGGNTVQTVEIEPGKSINFKATSTPGSAYQWFKDGNPISGATSPTLNVSEPGEYKVLAQNNLNCTSEISDGFIVTVKTSVLVKQANLSVEKKSETKATSINDPYEYLITVKNSGPDPATEVIIKDILPEGLIFKNMTMALQGKFDYNAAARTLTWTIDKLNSADMSELRFVTEAVNPGSVVNTATVSATEADPDLSDNSSTDTKSITDLTIPNVFTPNGDGVNDRFEIKNLEFYKENEISIINRWGNSVYEKKDYQNLWDGTGLDEGTYFFVLKVKNATGTWQAYKGYITLLRSKTAQ
ncbi:gliding motility-associated C-terminal domain-containing protein [Paradesertivirga mongoliensis]|uniref:Gliding motility-associated C-terminal domain-containing protein n=1 Tax=Paradesertivirga mongoliensis TaxID=2100740 RepID=A0ABW4ZN78_9SPHI|nr:gliding motility-associated C-terminal domain-containing protein [Pedobacter mongoliensis]